MAWRGGVLALALSGLLSPGAQAQLGGNWLSSQPNVYNVLDYGAHGDGVRLSATAINAALTAAGVSGGTVWIDFDPQVHGSTYLIDATLNVPSNVTIAGSATIKVQSALNNHAIRIAAGKSNIVISGITIDGNKANQSIQTGHCIATGGTGTVTNVRITNVTIHDCSADGISFAATLNDHLIVSNSYLYSMGFTGVECQNTCRNATFANNTLLNVGVNASPGNGGAGLLPFGKHIVLIGNTIDGTIQADCITGYDPTNDDFTATANSCRNSGNHGIHLGGTRMAYSANVIVAPAQYGIYHEGQGAVATTNCSITGNIIQGTLGAGIETDTDTGCVVSGNVVVGAATYGFLGNPCTNCSVTGNYFQGGSNDGIREAGAGANWTITGNMVIGNAGRGIYLPNVAGATITGNVVQGNSSTGIVTDATSANVVVADNFISGNGAAVSLASTTTRFHDNTGFNLGGFSSLPSCASTLEGSTSSVNDSNTATWGATIANGGGNHVLAYCDGSNWTVGSK